VKLNRPVRIIINIITSAIVVAVLALVSAVILVPHARGGAGLVIETASMMPTIAPGDVVAVRPVTYQELNIGDIVTFASEDALVTHRVIGFGSSGDGSRTVITQGDANNFPDEPLREGQIRGRVDYVIPRVGLLVPWLLRNAVWIVSAAALVFVASFGYDKWKALKQKRNPELEGKKENQVKPPTEILKAPAEKPVAAVTPVNEPAPVAPMAQQYYLAQPYAPVAPVYPYQAPAYFQPQPYAYPPAFAYPRPQPISTPAEVATTISTATSSVTFHEPVTISTEPGNGPNGRVTIVRTASTTTTFAEPITVTTTPVGRVAPGVEDNSVILRQEHCDYAQHKLRDAVAESRNGDETVSGVSTDQTIGDSEILRSAADALPQNDMGVATDGAAETTDEVEEDEPDPLLITITPNLEPIAEVVTINKAA